MTFVLSVLFGGVVGFSLGMTGGGGSLLAVPLLVFGLGIPPHDAFTLSLAAVGATALVGVLPRIRAGEVELPSGLLFALAGMAGAPVGTLCAERLSESLLLALFATLMAIVAVQMWWRAGQAPAGQTTPSTRRGEARRGALLVAVGAVTGFLSGMLGVGGGFIVVPALVLFARLDIHRAIGTSLLVVALVSTAGLASHLLAARTVAWDTAGLFIVGGAVGTRAGRALASHLSSATLQKVFSVLIVAVAVWLLAETWRAPPDATAGERTEETEAPPQAR